MKLNKKSVSELTPEQVTTLKPNEVIAAVLYSRIKERTTGEGIMPKAAYKKAISRVGGHLDADKGGLKKESYEIAPEGIQNLAKTHQAATKQRKLSDSLIQAVPFLKDAKSLPAELKFIKPMIDKVKGGFNKETFEELKGFPGFKEAAEDLRKARTLAKKEAPAKKAAKKDREPAI